MELVIDMRINNLRPVEICGVHTVFSKKGTHNIMKNRRCYGFSFAESGRIVYRQHGVSYVSNTAFAVFLPKGGTYEIMRKESGIFDVINFECEKDIFRRLHTVPVQNPERLKELYRKMGDALRESHALKALALFYEMLSDLGEEEPVLPLHDAVVYIEQHLGSASLSNGEIAAALGISETYFNRKFRAAYGTSPKQFILEKRIRAAKLLLGSPEKSVSEIAEACGWSNIYTFSRAFKNTVGLSPTAYRNKKKAQYL